MNRNDINNPVQQDITENAPKMVNDPRVSSQTPNMRAQFPGYGPQGSNLLVNCRLVEARIEGCIVMLLDDQIPNMIGFTEYVSNRNVAII